MNVLSMIAAKDTSEFTQQEWEAMGKHHAQAQVARCWDGTHYTISPGKNVLYLECVDAAARYELSRAEGFEKDYWRCFIIALNLSYFFYENRMGVFVIARNGRKIASAKTGALYNLSA